MGSISLICFILISKYADGLPLYRQESILSRYGGNISRATFANWIIALAKQLQPLINLMREHQHTGTGIMADETRVQVLKEPDKAVTSDKYRWVTLGGPPGEQSILFEYDPSRSGEVPLRLLDGLQATCKPMGIAAIMPCAKKMATSSWGAGIMRGVNLKKHKQHNPRLKKANLKYQLKQIMRSVLSINSI